MPKLPAVSGRRLLPGRTIRMPNAAFRRWCKVTGRYVRVMLPTATVFVVVVFLAPIPTFSMFAAVLEAPLSVVGTFLPISVMPVVPLVLSFVRLAITASFFILIGERS